MNKKISALRAAYASGNRARLRKAAQSLVAYASRHPFAELLTPEAPAIVALARKIVAA